MARGPQNDQTIESGRSFLAENRALVVATFKRQAKIGGVSFDDAGINIEELVELFIMLMSMTDFLNVSRTSPSTAKCNVNTALQHEEQRDTHLIRKLGFS